MFKVNNKDTRKGVFIVNFEHISYPVLVFLLLTLNIYSNCWLGLVQMNEIISTKNLQLIFTCSKSTIETPEKHVVFLLSTLKIFHTSF